MPKSWSFISHHCCLSKRLSANRLAVQSAAIASIHPLMRCWFDSFALIACCGVIGGTCTEEHLQLVVRHCCFDALFHCLGALLLLIWSLWHLHTLYEPRLVKRCPVADFWKLARPELYLLRSPWVFWGSFSPQRLSCLSRAYHQLSTMWSCLSRRLVQMNYAWGWKPTDPFCCFFVARMRLGSFEIVFSHPRNFKHAMKVRSVVVLSIQI